MIEHIKTLSEEKNCKYDLFKLKEPVKDVFGKVYRHKNNKPVMYIVMFTAFNPDDIGPETYLFPSDAKGESVKYTEITDLPIWAREVFAKYV